MGELHISEVVVTVPTANTPAVAMETIAVLVVARETTEASTPAWVAAAGTVNCAAAASLGAVILPKTTRAASSEPLLNPLRESSFCNARLARTNSIRVLNSVQPIESAISA